MLQQRFPLGNNDNLSRINEITPKLTERSEPQQPQEKKFNKSVTSSL